MSRASIPVCTCGLIASLSLSLLSSSFLSKFVAATSNEIFKDVGIAGRAIDSHSNHTDFSDSPPPDANYYPLPSFLHNLSPKLLAKSTAYVEKLLFKKFKSLPSYSPSNWPLDGVSSISKLESRNFTKYYDNNAASLVPLLTARHSSLPSGSTKSSTLKKAKTVDPQFVWWDYYEASPRTNKASEFTAAAIGISKISKNSSSLEARQLMPVYGQNNQLNFAGGPVYDGIQSSSGFGGNGGSSLTCQPLYTGTVFETTPIGTFVLQVRASSTSSSSFSSFGGNSGLSYSLQESAFGRFQINPQTGAITTANSLDRQPSSGSSGYSKAYVSARSAVEFRVRATDSYSGQYCESTVRLNIIPLSSPSLSSSIGVQNYPPVSSSFGTYNTPSFQPIIPSYSSSVPATYNNNGGGSISGNAVYGSTTNNNNNNYDGNSNNQAPVFLQVSYSFTITNCAPNAFIGVVQARDPDGDQISYSLLNSNSLFTIDPLSGQISMMTGFGSTYGGSVGVGLVMFRVLASDTRGAATQVNVFVNSQQCGGGGGGNGGGGDYYGSSSVNNYNTFPFANPYGNTFNGGGGGGGGTIGVYNTPPVYGVGNNYNNNNNNQPPRFLQQSYTFQLFSCLPGMFVGGINAQDPDSGPITYSLVNDNGLFNINAVTGQLTTSSNFPSFSIGPPNVYVFQAFASDTRGGSTQATITVTTAQCNNNGGGGGGGAYGGGGSSGTTYNNNNNPPFIVPSYIPLPQSAAYGSSAFNYNNNNNNNGYGNSNNNNNNAYGGGSNSGIFRFLQPSYIFGDTIRQQCFPNTVLGTVSVQGGAFPITYKILQSTTSSSASSVYGGGFLMSEFVVDYTSGVIRVGASTIQTQNGPIDRTFVVTAADANGRLASATVRVFCNGGGGSGGGYGGGGGGPVYGGSGSSSGTYNSPYDNNNNSGGTPPVFGSPTYTFNAQCGTTPSTTIGRVQATPSYGNDVTFNIRASSTTDFTVIDENNNFGRIQAVTTLATSQTYTFMVQATDSIGKTSSATVTVTVTCGQIPRFTPVGPISVSKSTPANTMIAKVMAVDPDGNSSNNNIRYATTSADVIVNPKTGDILSARSYASDTAPSFTATITATAESTNRTSSIDVVFLLKDGSPNTPTLVGTFPSSVMLNTANGACLDSFKVVRAGQDILKFRISDADTPSSKMKFILSDTSNFIISGITSPSVNIYEISVRSRTTLFNNHIYNLNVTVVDPEGNQVMTPSSTVTVSC